MPSPSLSWKMSRPCTTYKNWPSMVILHIASWQCASPPNIRSISEIVEQQDWLRTAETNDQLPERTENAYNSSNTRRLPNYFKPCSGLLLTMRWVDGIFPCGIQVHVIPAMSILRLFLVLVHTNPSISSYDIDLGHLVYSQHQNG